MKAPKKKARALPTSEGQKTPWAQHWEPWSLASKIYWAKGCLSPDGHWGKADSALNPQVWQGAQNTTEGDLGEEGTLTSGLKPAESSGGNGMCQNTGSTWEETREWRWRALLDMCVHSRCWRTVAKLLAQRNMSPEKQLAWLLAWKEVEHYFKLDKGALAKQLLGTVEVTLTKTRGTWR